MTDSFETILDHFSQGKFIIVLDEHREEEADFLLLAEYVTPEKINFLFTHAKGLICTACDQSILARLQIPLVVSENKDRFGTNFCMSVDSAHEITTGVSAPDRAKTISVLADPSSTPEDLVRPGHSFPLLAKSPSERFGHTESAVELAKKVGKIPAVVICEILNKEGEKANKEELLQLAKKWHTPFTTLKELQSFLS